MVDIIKLKTGSSAEEICSYSRAVVIGDWIYVSNTAGRNPVTQEMPEDFTEQANQVFENLEAALSAVGSTLADVIFSRVFIPDASDIPAAVEVIGKKFKGIDPATTITCPPLGGSIYKIEIELTAYKGASGLETTRMQLTR